MILATDDAKLWDARRAAYKAFKKMKAHRFLLKGYDYKFWWMDFDRKKYTTKIPVNHTDAEFRALIEDNKFHWYYCLSFVTPFRRPSFAYMPEWVFFVLDIDNITLAEVDAALAKWGFAKKYIVSRAVSRGGNGVHIHIYADLSSYRFEPNMLCDQLHYRRQERYLAHEKIRYALADSFEKDTGVKVDRNALLNNQIIPTPEEIAEVNRVWMGKQPVPIEAFHDLLPDQKAIFQIAYADVKSVMSDELLRFLDDPACVETVMAWVRDRGITPGKTTYYQFVRRYLKDHLPEVGKHLRSMDMAFMRTKKEGVAIESADTPRLLFGLKTTKAYTYFRHFAMYIWSLGVQEQYVYKRKATIFQTVECEARAFFSNTFLSTHWYAGNVSDIVKPDLSIDSLSGQLGSGKTFETLKREIPRFVSAFGPIKAIQMAAEAIRESSANEKARRIAALDGHVRSICGYWGLDESYSGKASNVRQQGQTPSRQRSAGPEPGGVPVGGLLDHQLAFGEEADGGAVRPPLQHAG